MDIKYSTDDGDYIDFYEFNAKYTPQGKRSMMTQKLAIPVILLLVLISTAIFHVGTIFIIIQIVLYSIFSFFWFRIQDKSIRGNADNVIAKMKQKGDIPYSRCGTLHFGEEEITEERENQTLTFGYGEVAYAYENGKALYIYLPKAKRVILLSAATLSDDGVRTELLGLLKQKIGEDKVCCQGIQ